MSANSWTCNGPTSVFPPLATPTPSRYHHWAFTRCWISSRNRLQGADNQVRIMRILAVCFLLSIVALPVSAQDWARTRVDKSPRHREWVTVKQDGRSVETFVVYPEVS